MVLAVVVEKVGYGERPRLAEGVGRGVGRATSDGCWTPYYVRVLGSGIHTCKAQISAKEPEEEALRLGHCRGMLASYCWGPLGLFAVIPGAPMFVVLKTFLLVSCTCHNRLCGLL